MNKYVLAFACAVAALAGGYATHLYYSAEISDMRREQAEAVRKDQEDHAQQLAKATDTILLAQSEYDGVRSELDRALTRLRDYNRRVAKGSTESAIGKRLAACRRMVSRLAEAGSKCGEGWQRTATKHAALAEAVR